MRSCTSVQTFRANLQPPTAGWKADMRHQDRKVCVALQKELSSRSGQRVPAGTACGRRWRTDELCQQPAVKQLLAALPAILCSQHPITGHIYSEMRVFGRHMTSCSLIDVYGRFGRSCRLVTGICKHKITPNCWRKIGKTAGLTYPDNPDVM